MIEKNLAAILAKTLALKLRDALASFDRRLSDFDERIKTIPAGPQGPQGVPGESIVGPQGVPGESIVGPPGKDGESIQGVAGRDGKDGESIDFELAVSEVTERSLKSLHSNNTIREMARIEVAKAVAVIPEPKDGVNGNDGKDGKDGKDADPVPVAEIVADVARIVTAEAQKSVAIGLAAIPIPKDGVNGIDGKDGKPGEKGIDGRDGREGKDGVNGADGRDALQIDILPAIHESKSFPRGTFAKHKGGIVRAIRNTDPIGEDGAIEQRGWECIVEGVCGVSWTQGEDWRTLSVESSLTSGAKSIATFYFPVVIDKGVWKVGNEFTQGDLVSHDGSMWICQVEKTVNQPGNGSSDWRLSVKRGRDGKDLTDRKDPPPNGPVRLK